MFKEIVLNKLRQVIDPEVRIDVITLNVVYDIKVNNKTKDVSLKFRPTVPNCPIGIQLGGNIKKALIEIEGINKIDIKVVDFILKEQAEEYIDSIGQ